MNSPEPQKQPATRGASPESLDPTTWVDEHGDALYRYALLRVRRAEVAEDLVQEALLAAFKGRDRFAGRSDRAGQRLSLRRRRVLLRTGRSERKK